MNTQQHNRLVEWIIDAHKRRALGPSSIADVCASASVATGLDVTFVDYIAARRDSRCVRAMGPAVGDAHDLLTTETRTAKRRDRRRPMRESREPAIALVNSIAATACAELRMGGVPKPLTGHRGESSITCARRIVWSAARRLLPDETDRGVAKVIADAVGGGVDGWTGVNPCSAMLQLVADRIVASHQPIRGKLDWSTGVQDELGRVSRQPGRPRKSLAPGGRSGVASPLVAANGLSGAGDLSGGAP